MHVLRFFLTRPSPPAVQGCAPTRRRIRVLTLSKQLSLQLRNSLPSRSLEHPKRTVAALCRSPISQAHLKATFKPHSPLRPPQNASGFLLVSLSKTPRGRFLNPTEVSCPRRFRSRLATSRPSELTRQQETDSTPDPYTYGRQYRSIRLYMSDARHFRDLTAQKAVFGKWPTQPF
jgi:hypothetical protein